MHVSQILELGFHCSNPKQVVERVHLWNERRRPMGVAEIMQDSA